MDQDSFRRLLQERKATGSPATGSRGSFATAPLPKKTVDASQPAFKPRNVKKPQESKYRDRASERRTGNGNDYAHVEAVLEDFEKRNASSEDRAKVEAQRKYLGGDSEHSILVKGLDFALLEQNKARSALTTEDIDELDQAYKEAGSKYEPTVPKKRTREDLIKELKEQRAAQTSPRAPEEETRLLEEAKQKGKFKPIGFKPIGSSSSKKKSKVEGTDGEKKKKKCKLEGVVKPVNEPTASSSSAPPPTLTAPSAPPESEEPVNDDFDIFAGAGEYEGITLDDDNEDHDGRPQAPDTSEPKDELLTSTAPRRWIETDEPLPETRPRIPFPSAPRNSASLPPEQLGSDDEGEQRPIRLVPLASSTLPSIKDLLAIDKAAESYDRKKKRKEKKKGGSDDEGANPKTKGMDAKVERDYKRLKSYTDKKGSADSQQ
ncbi:RED-like protein N-terminal region-domain-containing protein [Gymnopilus junonius]|uniref:RED-like protein N-terminal region-domain-containing protein n=1 Tax=Gymnopilus junonius TaxID=109634 RepID=A0A9P5NV59_GYMJU|nr:RED-like protein N-terminal region-domain-containing protein [Gymnopilus junonius]